MKKHYGLLGKNIGYSLSPQIHKQAFEAQGICAEYSLLDVENITEFMHTVREEKKLDGFNVTTPYKSVIAPLLDYFDNSAKATIYSINTVKCVRNGNDYSLWGYNTDTGGFGVYFNKYPLQKHKALIFGSGGAADSVAYALELNRIPYLMVSRNNQEDCITYPNITHTLAKEYTLWINCTPVGGPKYPNQLLPLPYETLTAEHILIDLNYIPNVTPFMEQALKHGATTCNGMPMLEEQARLAREIWAK